MSKRVVALAVFFVVIVVLWVFRLLLPDVPTVVGGGPRPVDETHSLDARDETEPTTVRHGLPSPLPDHDESATSLRVVDSAGIPLPGVIVLGGHPSESPFLESVEQALPQFDLILQTAGVSAFLQSSVSVTDSVGVCTPAMSSPGRLMLAERSRGLMLLDWPISPQMPRDVEFPDQVAVEVRLANPGPREAQLLTADSAIMTLRLDAAGAATTPPLPPGGYRITAPEHQMQEFDVPSSGADIRVVLSATQGIWKALLCDASGQAYDATRLSYELQAEPSRLLFLFANDQPNLARYANDFARPRPRYEGASGELSARRLPPGVTYLGVWHRLRLLGYATVDAVGGKAPLVLVANAKGGTASVSLVLESSPGVQLDREATVELGVFAGGSFGSVVQVTKSPDVPCFVSLREELIGAEVWGLARAPGFVPEWQRVQLPASEGFGVVRFELRRAAHSLRVEAPGATAIACIGMDNRWVTDPRASWTQDGGVTLTGLPDGQLRILAQNGREFGHCDVNLPNDAGSTVVVKLLPGRRGTIDNATGDAVQLIATDASGVVVSDERMFFNEHLGPYVPFVVPASARFVKLTDSAGSLVNTMALPETVPLPSKR